MMIMTDAEYRARPGVNYSTLKNMAKSPLHYHWGLTHDRDDTAAMLAGRAVHAAILRPDEFAAMYAARPAGLDGRTVAGKKWLADNAEKEKISEADSVAIRILTDRVREHRVASELIRKAAATELPIFWTDAETGLACKAKLDLVTVDGILVDLKKTVDLLPSLFFAQAYRLKYHVQAAFYRDGLVANGIDVPSVKILALEGTAPHDVAVFRVPDDVVAQGRAEYRRMLNRVKECQDARVWPGIFQDESDFQLPGWAVWDDPGNAEDEDLTGIME